MGAEKDLNSVHPCRHRQTSTIWSETIYNHTQCMGAEKALDSVHPCMHRQASTIWSETYSTSILTVWEQRRLWTLCTHAGIDNIYNLVLDFIYIHTHCMGAKKALDSVQPCRHRQTSTIWSETIYLHTHCLGAENALDGVHPCRQKQTSTIWSETSSTFILTV